MIRSSFSSCSWAIAVFMVAGCLGEAPMAESEGSGETSSSDDSGRTTGCNDAVPTSDPGTLLWENNVSVASPTGHESVSAAAADAYGRTWLLAATADAPGDTIVVQADAGGASRWSEVYDGLAGLSDVLTDVVTTSDGGAIVVGIEERQVIHYEYWADRKAALVVLAYGPDGQHRWRALVEGEELGSAYRARVSLRADDSIVAGVHIMARDGSDEIGIFELSPHGEELERWTHVPADVYRVALSDLAVDDEGTIYVTADAVPSSGGEYAVFTGAFDETHALAWSDTIVGEGAAARRIETTSEGPVAMALYQPNGRNATLVRAYDHAGNARWTFEHEESFAPVDPRGMAIDCQENIIVAGSVGDAIAWVLALRADGKLQWSEMVLTGSPLTYVTDVATLPSGNVVLAGQTWIDPTFDLFLGEVSN